MSHAPRLAAPPRPRLAEPAQHRSGRTRGTVTLACGSLLAAAAIAGCGGASPSGPARAVTTRTATPASGPRAVGRQVFESAGCASCHTLAAAGSSGTVGPNLDSLKPTYATVVHQVTDGGGGMPAFRGQLSTPKIDDVAQFVVSVTR